MNRGGRRGEPAGGRRGEPAGGPEYEGAVLREFRRVLFEYCALAAVRLPGTARPRLRITVATRHPVEGIRDELRGLAWQTIDRDLHGATIDEIVQVRDWGIGGTPCRVVITPAVDPDAHAEPYATGPTQPIVDPAGVLGTGGVLGAGGGVVLTLAYGGRFRWAYPLTPAPDWIPLGRGLPATDHAPGIRLPGHATPVPRGVLVMLRCWRGTTELRRSPQRGEYVVTVDGTRLRPGATVPVRPAGSIDFGRPGRVGTTLRYRLSRED